MAPFPTLASTLARTAREMHVPRDLASTLDTIVRVAQGSMPGIDHVTVTMAPRRGRLQTMAATGQVVRDLDALQYALGEGPCVHAIRSAADTVVVVEHAGHEQRWPRYLAQARERGLCAQLSVRLFVEDGESMGGLNMYSFSRGTIGEETHQLAELFAAQAAGALKHVLREEDLSTALASRTVIGTAVGIVMERYHLDEQRPFTYLSRVSQDSNVKLRDVAREIVEHANAGQRRQDQARSRPGYRDPDGLVDLPSG